MQDHSTMTMDGSDTGEPADMQLQPSVTRTQIMAMTLLPLLALAAGMLLAALF